MGKAAIPTSSVNVKGRLSHRSYTICSQSLRGSTGFERWFQYFRPARNDFTIFNMSSLNFIHDVPKDLAYSDAAFCCALHMQIVLKLLQEIRFVLSYLELFRF